MERRYQVFVSSTFEDLEEARREVSMALLKSDCFPAGMELFPAADLEQFEYIKQIIVDSDYFMIVSAGKYGSIHPKTGISYTEMEYDFAIEIGKPIIRLLHRDPLKTLPGGAIEQTDDGKARLQTLRNKLSKSRLVSLWNDTKDLGQQTILALLDIKKRRPSPGWVRGKNALTVDMLKELETLRSSVQTSSSKKTEKLIKFSDLKNKTSVPILEAFSDKSSTGDKKGDADIKNKEIAEAVFLSLISNYTSHDIGQAASDILTDRFSFPGEYHKYNHYWLELGGETVEHFLHYLESRGLLNGTAPSLGHENWQLNQRGRMHATYLSSMRNLG